MGRPRKPTAVLNLAGRFKHDPQRGREREKEPQPKGKLGPPPRGLDPSQSEVWKEIAKSAWWLSDADRFVVEQTCRCVVLERLGKATIAEKRLLAMNLRALGMTPADRSRVKVEGQEPTKPKTAKPAAPANPFKRLRA